MQNTKGGAMKHPSAFESVDLRNPREVLLHHARRLVAFLESPAVPKQIVAEEVFFVFKTGLTYCNQHLAARFMNWLLSDSLKEVSACKDCPSFEDESFKGCSSCNKAPAPTI